jgi:general secretion pathway protein M
MKDWLTSLEPRERLFIAAAAGFVVLAVAWFGLWQPLDQGHQAASERVETWQQSLAQLRPMRGQVQAAASGRPAAAGQNQSLVVIVDNSVRSRGLTNALQRSQPTPAGNGIRIEFENAGFDDLMLWLGDLHRQFSLQVDSASFSVATAENPGRVNASITLLR